MDTISSRRRFIRALAAGAAGTACGAAALHAGAESEQRLLDQVAQRYGEYPLRAQVARFHEQQAKALASFRATNLDRREYLRLANGIVRFFVRHQDARGAIIDPFEGKERQYATPAFACAAAVLSTSGYAVDLLPYCMKAMDAATSDIAAGRVADNHADFSTVMLMHAFNVLRRGPVPEARIREWQENLRRIVPERVYRVQPDSPRITNWNLVAVSGEWMRYRAGLSPDTRWIEASLARHMSEFTAFGMYRDPNDPLAYDHFARYYVVNMLEHGYNGRYAALLDELMERGAWTSLFMQSPHGELPCGGRSAHHQWNEAEQTMTYETYARRLARRGRMAAAGAFKRAARLALGSIGRWVRPSGELWIVKNRFDPALRHGYETYSFHSQYNLLTAAKLAVAYLRADDRINERPCPADTGGFAFVLQPAFHKIFANAGGMYLEIDTRADAKYNPTGLLRVHRAGVDPQLSISDGATTRCAYHVPQRPSRALAIGPAWRDRAGAWHALAEHDAEALRDAEVKVLRESPAQVEFEVVYRGTLRGGATIVRQRFRVSPSRIEVADTVEGEITGRRQYFPLLVTDGQRHTRIAVSGRRATAAFEGTSTHAYEIRDEESTLARLGTAEPFRNGLLDAAWAESARPTMNYTILPATA
jgi:hypothetical protein